jgi:hypothetical protein
MIWSLWRSGLVFIGVAQAKASIMQARRRKTTRLTHRDTHRSMTGPVEIVFTGHARRP